MGNAMGVKDGKKEEKDDTEVNEDGEVDYKKNSGFASHMKKQDQSNSSSDFAKTKR